MMQSKADRDSDEAMWLRIALLAWRKSPPTQVFDICGDKRTKQQWESRLKELEG